MNFGGHRQEQVQQRRSAQSDAEDSETRERDNSARLKRIDSLLIGRIFGGEISSGYLRDKITPEKGTFDQSNHSRRPIELRELIVNETLENAHFAILTRIVWIVPLGNVLVWSLFIATILTPKLHRIPKAIRNPNELRKAI
jgi:hypothetical protein